MKHIATLLVIATVLVFAGVTVLAHEMTYKGTVLAATASSVQVNVIDDTSKKETPMTFSVTPKTKVFRGEKAVTLGDARIQKDERIAVTVDHDQNGHAATVIRLAAQK